MLITQLSAIMTVVFLGLTMQILINKVPGTLLESYLHEYKIFHKPVKSLTLYKRHLIQQIIAQYSYS